MATSTENIRKEISECMQKSQNSETAVFETTKNIEILRSEIDKLKNITALKEDLEKSSTELNTNFRRLEIILNEMQNSVITLGNYAEKYVPFYFQKAIHDAFIFITKDQYEKKLSAYFPRIYRTIHHKILNTNGKPELEKGISELNKLFEETRYENIGIPITTNRFGKKADPPGILEEKIEDLQKTKNDEENTKKSDIATENLSDFEKLMRQFEYKFNMMMNQTNTKIIEQKSFLETKNEEMNAYLQTVHMELQNYIKKIRQERSDYVFFI